MDRNLETPGAKEPPGPRKPLRHKPILRRKSTKGATRIKYLLLIDRQESKPINVFSWNKEQDKLLESCLPWFKWIDSHVEKFQKHERIMLCEFKGVKEYEKGKKLFNKRPGHMQEWFALGKYQGLVQPYGYSPTLNNKQKKAIKAEHSTDTFTVGKLAEDWDTSEREIRRIVNAS